MSTCMLRIQEPMLTVLSWRAAGHHAVIVHAVARLPASAEQRAVEAALDAAVNRGQTSIRVVVGLR